jgi:hypothetical protein
MAEVKAVFYLPVRDNDGRDLSNEIEEVLRRIYLLSGGWTRIGLFRGTFRMKDGSQSIDECQVYAAKIDEVDIGVVEGILRDFKSGTTQESIYLEIQRDVDFRFV